MENPLVAITRSERIDDFESIDKAVSDSIKLIGGSIAAIVCL